MEKKRNRNRKRPHWRERLNIPTSILHVTASVVENGSEKKREGAIDCRYYFKETSKPIKSGLGLMASSLHLYCLVKQREETSRNHPPGAHAKEKMAGGRDVGVHVVGRFVGGDRFNLNELTGAGKNSCGSLRKEFLQFLGAERKGRFREIQKCPW